jgi:release factor glutamine methyltransferase
MNRAPDTGSIRELLDQATHLISGTSARLDAEVLLAHVMDKPRSHLLAWPDKVPDPGQQSRYREMVTRRAAGEPVAHLVGYREFWSLRINVTRDTLIPRPETETLVARALDILPVDGQPHIADLGTGSGAIAIALAHERPDCHIVASDISDVVLEVAAGNAEQLQLDNIEFASGNWCEALAGQRFDLIVSNPPYIPRSDVHLDSGDVRFEARTALVAGIEGMDDLRHIASCACRHLNQDGWLLMEHGYDQGKGVRSLLAEYGYRDIVSYTDDTGHERVTGGRL